MSKLRSFAKNKFFVSAACVGVVALATVEIRQLQKQMQVQKEISDLQKQAENLQKENSELQKLSDYLKTGDYVEKAAREQLNKKKEGEYVYSFSEQNSNQTIVAPAQTKSQDNPELSNPQKWWKYFFDHQS